MSRVLKPSKPYNTLCLNWTLHFGLHGSKLTDQSDTGELWNPSKYPTEKSICCITRISYFKGKITQLLKYAKCLCSCFSHSPRSLVKYFSTLEEKFRISSQPCNIVYNSFENITPIIHYKQLLLTKFGRILRYSTDDVNRAAKLPHYWTVNRESGETFYSFHEGEIGSKNIKKTTPPTTFAIWRIFA